MRFLCLPSTRQFPPLSYLTALALVPVRLDEILPIDHEETIIPFALPEAEAESELELEV